MNKIGALFVTFVTALSAAISFGIFSTIPYNEFFKDMGILRGIGLVFYYLFPRITFLDNVSSSLLFGKEISLVLWEQILHLVVITGAYVYLANYLVKRKNF